MRAALLALVLAALPSASAFAYPQWQLSTGAARCSACHFAPGGGGLPNNFGRDANGDDLSTFAGEGEFLYGVVPLPRWLSTGVDLRGAYAAHEARDINGTSQAFFPMQADLSVRVAPGWGFSAYATGGLRGQVRSNDTVVPRQNYQPISTSRLISREHWLMWQQGGEGWYVRAGRFFAPFGLRMAEHILYVRRDLGFGQLEESYNVSGGFVNGDWELHLTAFAPDFLRHIGSDEGGGAAYFERRVLNQTGAFAFQSRVAFGPGAYSITNGAILKHYVAPIKTLFLGEADLVHRKPDEVAGLQQLVGTVGAALLPARGLMLTVLGERSQDNLAVARTGWTAFTGLLGWFPVPHAELQLMARAQLADGNRTAKTLFLQVHYFL